MRSHFVASFLTLLVASASSAACLGTRYVMFGEAFASPDPVGNVSRSSPYYPYNGDGQVTWDARTGQAAASGSSGGIHSGGGGQVSVSDQFELVGVPPGATVRVTAALDVYGCYRYDFGYGTSSLGQLSDGTRTVSWSASNGCGLTRIQLDLDMTPGVAQTLTYLADVSCTGTSGRTQVQLVFLGLPPGASIVSCRGFQTGAITPTRATSWGRLKQHYR